MTHCPIQHRFASLVIAAAAAMAPLACDKKTNAPPPEQEIQRSHSAASQPAPHSNVELGDPLGPVRKRAEGGDVQAMITLGRAYEALGGADNKAKARQWYQKAAATGDEDAKLAVRMLDALNPPPATAGSSAASDLALAAAPPPTTNSAATAATGRGATPPPTSTSGTRAATQPAAPRDLGKLSWNDILASVDTSGFGTDTRPAYRKRPGEEPRFIGLSGAPDQSIVLAASGPTGDDLHEVSMVLRLRNTQNLESNTRVVQAATVAGVATNGNVTQADVAEWINTYISTQRKLDPIFRAGWQIDVTGPKAQGMEDKKAQLGQAVLIEMKK